MANPDRRTSLPTGTRVIADGSGFEARLDGAVIAQVRWNELSAIYAYARRTGEDVLTCLDFVLIGGTPDDRDTDHRIVVDESLDGWSSLIDVASRSLPSFDRGWARKVQADSIRDLLRDGVATTLPIFLANPVEVWRHS
jgi:hypothetical protein